MQSFTSTCSNVQSGFHLHYGADKQSVGILYPALCKSDSLFVIVQGNEKGFEKITEDTKEIQVSVNLVKVGEPLVIQREADSFPATSSIFLATNCDDNALLNVMKRASSISCSEAHLPDLAPLLKQLPKSANPPIVYAATNKQVGELAKELAGRVRIRRMALDRIVSQQTFTSDGRILVEAEPWEGHIAIFPTLELPDEEGSSDKLFLQKTNENDMKRLSFREKFPLCGRNVATISDKFSASVFAMKQLQFSAALLDYTVNVNSQNEVLKKVQRRLQHVYVVMNNFGNICTEIPDPLQLSESMCRPQYIVPVLKSSIVDMVQEIRITCNEAAIIQLSHRKHH